MYLRLREGLKKYWAAWAVFFGLCLILLTCFDALCPMRILFGMPCPGCGLTRSVSLFLKGQWRASIWMHPMGILAFSGAVLWAGEWYQRKSHRLSEFYWIVWAVLCVILYLYRMPQRFPDVSPMLYEPEHLIHALDWIWEKLAQYLI